MQIKSLNSHNWLNRSTNVPPLDSRFACRQYNQSADAIWRAKCAKAGKEIARESSKNGCGRFSREKQNKLALLSMARINTGNTMNGMKRRRQEQNKADRKHCTAICLSLLVLKVVVVEFLSIYLSCLWVTFSCLF